MKGNEIQRLRQEGYGYVRIAQMLGLSENSVKSFCRRHPLPVDDSRKQAEGMCPQCGTKVDSRHRFCSDACRAGWYESHSSDEQDILRLCKTCGKPFEPRHPKQVYCSKQCFYNDRYHSKSTITEDENLQQALMSIPHKAAVALVKMTMEYLIASGWQAPGIVEHFDPSNVADALYMKLSLKPLRD